MASPLREEIFNLPNTLTLVRIGSIPIVVALLYLPGMFWSWLAAAVFLVAGLTDMLDGWLARRLKKVSLMGQYLDPLADKLLVSCLLVVLVGMGRCPAWIAVMLIAREIAVTGLRAIAASQGFAVPSDLAGKSKTALQMLGLVLLISHYNLGGFDPHYWGMAVLYVALVVSVWSGVVYFYRFRKRYLAK